MGRVLAVGSTAKLLRPITVSGTNGQVLPNLTALIQGLEFTALMEQILVSEIPATYAQPSVGLSALLAGPVEVGTTLTPSLTATWSQGDAGAVTGFQLNRDATVFVNNTVAPIVWPGMDASNPAYADSYVLPLGTTTYSATFNYAQGLQKLGNKGSVSPGQITAGSKTATRSIAALFRSYFGYSTSNAVQTVAQLVALGSGTLQAGKGRSLSGATAGTGNYTIYAWPSSGSDDIASILFGPEEIRTAFGAVRYATGPNALGATVTMGYITSNAPNAFTNANLTFI